MSIIFGKFSCSTCANYDKVLDNCVITGDTNIAWRADRTCCGVEEWHVLSDNHKNFLKVISEAVEDFKCVSQDKERKVFISSYTKKEFMNLAKLVERILEHDKQCDRAIQ